MKLGGFFSLFFGPRAPAGTILSDTVEVFRPNAEKSAARADNQRRAALEQYGAEFFVRPNRTSIDALADGLNRLVRPVVAFGLLYPIVATISAPEKMTRVWIAIATLPPGYWAVVGIVLPFYFGGRMQIKALQSAHWMAAAQATIDVAERETTPDDPQENAALREWIETKNKMVRHQRK